MIKYIGQHIFDFIARFRQDVRFHGSIRSEEGGNLNLQSDGSVHVGMDDDESGSTTRFRVGNTGSVSTTSFLNYSGTTGELALNIFTDPDTSFFNTGLLLSNLVNSANPAEIKLEKRRGTFSPGQNSDSIGRLIFSSNNAASPFPERITFAEIVATIGTAADTDEAGNLSLKVAASDGSTSNLRQALTARGEGANDIVSVDLAYGATSVSSVAGKLNVVGRLTAQGQFSIGGHILDDVLIAGDTFVDDDLHFMTAAAIDDRINAAGGGVSVSDSTANTDFPVVFHDESNNLHDDTGAFTYNPFTGLLACGKGNIPSLVADTLKVDTHINLGHATDTTIARSAAGKVTIEGNQIVTAGAVSVASGSQAAVGMQVARRTITTGEANAMNSTPIEIVPAQGANTIIMPVSGRVRVDRAATQTNAAADFNMHYEGLEPGNFFTTSLMHLRRFMYNETGDREFNLMGPAGELAQSLTQSVNKAVEMSFDSATTNNCFTSIDVFLIYYVIDIS